MKILVIGNGFDLAHGLPTSYIDFLEFCKRARNIYTYSNSAFTKQYEYENLQGWEISDYVKKRLKNAFENREYKKEDGDKVTTSDTALNELYLYINQNTWLEYFLDCPSYVGENWIDFESEISRVVRSLDDARIITKNGESVLDIRDERGKILLSLVKAAQTTLQTVFIDVRAIEKFSQDLYIELERLTRALEIYISEFVRNIAVEKESVDIKNLNPDHILSFNYSDTYERVYGKGREIEYDYMHGRADINNTIQTNNMVLGIDEYLSEELKDKDTEFIAFKKYYQRIYKKSKRLTEVWCSEIKKEAEYEKNSRKFMLEEQIGYELVSEESGLKYSWQNHELLIRKYEEQYNTLHPKHEIYIFGHSLDVTDKDVLRDLLLNDNVHTTIFYCKKKDNFGNCDNGRKDYGQKITNLVKVIGQDELKRRTGGAAKNIEFKLQQDMKETEA